MIDAFKNTNLTIDAIGANVMTWDVCTTQTSTCPANHNLSREAREANVVPLGGHHGTDDFRPDIGARLTHAA